MCIRDSYGPNWEDLKTLVELIQPFAGVRLYSLPEFEANYKGFSGDGTEAADHAGKVETSLLWAVRPDCVDVSRMPAEHKRGEQFAMGKDAYLANRQAGERMVADEVAWLGEKARALLEEYDRGQPEHNFTTFEQVEQVWADVVAPALPSFRTMQQKWDRQNDLPAGSPWARNNKVPGNWR